MKTNKIIITILLIVMANIAMAQTKKENFEYYGDDEKYYAKETYIANDQYKDKADESPVLENLAVEYNYFSITQRPQKVYKGVYKDNKPYDGFFVDKTRHLLEDITTVVKYYEKAVLVSEYIYYFFDLDKLNDFITEPIVTEPIVIDKETIHENGKIKSGYNIEFLKTEEDNIIYGLKAMRYENFEFKDFFIDLFAVHLFNRLSFSMKDNQLIIKIAIDSTSIHIKKVNDKLIADYFKDDKMLFSSDDIIKEVKSKTPNSISVFSLDQNNDIIEDSHQYTSILKEIKDDIFFSCFFVNFPIRYELQTRDFMEELSNIDFKHPNFLYKLKLNINPKYLTNVCYNENGKVEMGAIPTKKSDGTFQLDIYSSGEIVSTTIYKTVEELLKAIEYFHFHQLIPNSFTGCY